MPEGDFLKTWRSFFAVVNANGQEFRHEIPKSEIRQRSTQIIPKWRHTSNVANHD